MKVNLDILQLSPLFLGMDQAEIQSTLNCLSAVQKKYGKDEYVLRSGTVTESFGLVLSGNILVIWEDFWGNRNIITHIGAGEIFAESFASLPNNPLSVDAVAQEPTQVLFLNISKVLTTCSLGCASHNLMIRNLVSMLAAKNLKLNEKLQHITQRSTREKILSFLSAQSARNGSSSFEVPFNRQQMADYLSVDRSAMSNELCKLRDEGVLAFQHNHFQLHS